MTNQDPITAAFTILVDQREKAPYRFTGLRADAKHNRRPLIVPTESGHMKTGDYAIKGLEHLAVVERKSLADLYSTLGQNRERFEREHERMAADVARPVIVVEASWFEVVNLPPDYSRLNPKTVFRTAISWYVRYGVPWIMAEDRRLAELYTFQFLTKVWKEKGDQ